MNSHFAVDEPPVVSVVCPIYNGAAWLQDAVDSIRRQSFSQWELVLLDDGSTDGSGDLCAELSTTDPRIRHSRHGENHGLGATMADLVAQARGRYIAVQEQDDISLPSRLGSEVEFLEAEPGVGVVSGMAEWFGGGGNRLALFPGVLCRGSQYPQETAEMVRFLFINQCKVVNAGCMFRREVLSSPGVSFDRRARMSVDWQFFLRVAHHWRIWGLPEVVVRVRRGTDHASLSSQLELRHREARRCIKLVYKEYRNRPDSPIDKSLCHKAMATELITEGRHYGRSRGLALLLEAAILDPKRRLTWSSIHQLMLRATKGIIKALGVR